MVDITKEEFWNNREEIAKNEFRQNKVKGFIKRNKIITALLIGLGVLITINTILIYNFIKIITNI